MTYKIIYADPPWEYKAWSKKGEGRSAESHYKTQGVEYLMNMPVQNICEKDSVLLMWATYPCLQEAIKLGIAWGFTYKTVAFTWIKKNRKSDSPFIGMGYYTRSNAEICLLFTKGKPLKRVNKNVEQVLFSPIGKHSQKPSEIRNRIVDLFGDVSRVELFARTRSGMFGNHEYEGWAVFGNQVDNSITL